MNKNNEQLVKEFEQAIDNVRGLIAFKSNRLENEQVQADIVKAIDVILELEQVIDALDHALRPDSLVCRCGYRNERYGSGLGKCYYCKDQVCKSCQDVTFAPDSWRRVTVCEDCYRSNVINKEQSNE